MAIRVSYENALGEILHGLAVISIEHKADIDRRDRLLVCTREIRLAMRVQNPAPIHW